MKFGSYHVPVPALFMSAGILTIAAVFALWPAGLGDGFDIVKSAGITDYTWQTVKLDTQGRIVRIGSSPIGLGALCSLIGVCLLGVAVSAYQLLRGGVTPAAAAAVGPVLTAMQASKVEAQMRKAEVTGQKLDNELSTVLKLIQNQLGSSDRYSAVLDDASIKLPDLKTVDQIEKIVELLVAENLRVRREVSDLKRGLETSQSQIEKLHQGLRDAEEQGTVDGLTALKNRRWFDTNGAKAVARAHSESTNISLVMADIDNFKKINDTFGHQVGDEVLKRFSELLTQNIKGQDSAVRYGGEEFTLLLPNTSIAGAHQLTDSMRKTLESKRWLDQKTGKPLGMVTASFGVAQLRKGERLNDLVSRADAKLYEAKRTGKNRVVCDE